MPATPPRLTEMTLHRRTRVLQVAFSDGSEYRLAFELLRVYSPSAEVQGHGPGQEVLQVGKQDVEVVGLEPVGNYGIKPTFSDGHDTGIFTFAYLYELGRGQEALLEQYRAKLAAAGHAPAQ